jgi:DNA-binding NarL/FixJ family response regulator
MYSAADYVEMLIFTWTECQNAQRFPNRNHPNHKRLISVIAQTVETSQILPNRKEIGGAPRTVRTVENEEAILDAFEEGIETFKEVAQELNISKTSVK